MLTFLSHCQAESLVGAQDLMGAARLLENVVQLVPEEVG